MADVMVNAKPSPAPKACAARWSMCGAWRPACNVLHDHPGKVAGAIKFAHCGTSDARRRAWLASVQPVARNLDGETPLGIAMDSEPKKPDLVTGLHHLHTQPAPQRAFFMPRIDRRIEKRAVTPAGAPLTQTPATWSTDHARHHHHQQPEPAP